MIKVSFNQLEDLEQSVDRQATGSHRHHSVIKRCTLATWIRRDGMCVFVWEQNSRGKNVDIFSHLDSENYAGDFFNQNPFHYLPYLKPGVGIDDLKGKLCMAGKFTMRLWAMAVTNQDTKPTTNLIIFSASIIRFKSQWFWAHTDDSVRK